MTIMMRRRALSSLNNKNCQHAGLLIDRGFKEDRGTEKHNDDKIQLFSNARDISIPETYKQAYEDWKQTQLTNSNNSQYWIGRLLGRMYLGMGEANPLEAGITLHHTYGVPLIPGSAIKGVVSHYVNELEMDASEKKEIKNTLFGQEADANNRQDSGSAGYVIFNDAWWVPEGKALTPEMVTVHAVEYYKNKGKTNLHPDFESPNPNPQIAIQGSFFFSVEGQAELAEYAMSLLKKALHEKGIGGKTSSGYGYFEEDMQKNKTLQKNATEARRSKMSPEDGFRDELTTIEEKNLAEMFGKSFNKTKKKYEAEGCNWEAIIQILIEEKKNIIEGWNPQGDKQKKNTAQGKAFNKLKTYL